MHVQYGWLPESSAKQKPVFVVSGSYLDIIPQFENQTITEKKQIKQLLLLLTCQLHDTKLKFKKETSLLQIPVFLIDFLNYEHDTSYQLVTNYHACPS